MKDRNPFRTSNKKTNKKYIVTVIETKDKQLAIPLPNELVKAYGICVGDVAIFEKINKKSFSVRFVKNTMYSLVEPLQ